jgi:hypothetical protein
MRRHGRPIRPLVAAVLASVLVFSVVGSAAAATSYWLYLNKGVHKARLGTSDRVARSRVGLKLANYGKDSSYEGQTVYRFRYGRKRTGGYDVEMYSDKKRTVWLFVVNGTMVKTAKGIRVGSSEAALKKAYGSAIKRKPGDIYTVYTYGTPRGLGTDFYVRNSTKRVTQMHVRNW